MATAPAADVARSAPALVGAPDARAGRSRREPSRRGGPVVRARAGHQAVSAARLRDSRRAAPDGQGDPLGLSGDAPKAQRPNVGNAWLWDPAAGYGSNAFKQVAPPNAAPIYCVGESLLANGDLFIAGGNLDLVESKGLNRTFTFNPFTETWHRQGDLRHGRWYPGQVVLPDGRVAILGGYTEKGRPGTTPSSRSGRVAIWRRPTTQPRRRGPAGGADLERGPKHCAVPASLPHADRQGAPGRPGRHRLRAARPAHLHLA